MSDIFSKLRATTVGIDAPIVTTDLQNRITTRRRTYLDSAATCLEIGPVAKAKLDYLAMCCANSHTEATTSGRDTTEQLHNAHDDVAALLGASSGDAVIFVGAGATGAMNFLADAIKCKSEKPIAIVSSIEHHSNILPWRKHFELVYLNALPDGSLDLNHLATLLKTHAGKVCLVAVTAVSNVTGVIPPLEAISSMVHDAGAMLVVDAAQAASHVPLNKTSQGIDFLVGSGHKMYAPGSPGFLIAPKNFFDGIGWKAGSVGGGSVDRVELDRVWLKNDPSERYEGGTPNIPGGIALGVSARLLRSIGMRNVMLHEKRLIANALDRIQHVPGAVVYGPTDVSNKTAVVAFNVDDLPNSLVSCVLNDFFGVQTRNGCFCAEPYTRQQITAACEVRGFCQAVNAGKTGMVRMSLGIYSDDSDIDRLVHALEQISTHRDAFRAHYEEVKRGTWVNKTFRSSTGFDYRSAVDRFLTS